MLKFSVDNFVAKMNEIAAKNKVNFDKLAIAVSGGADSLALAWLIKKMRQRQSLKIVALTVNHHLRPEAESEALMVSNLMKQWGIEHHILEWYGGKDVVAGVEEKAREARYALLEDWCIKNDFCFLLTAHHLRDQAETFLMRLQRGSGVDGLSAMSDFSRRGQIFVVRPLLEFEPSDLKSLLLSEQINWAEDASNQCDDYLRVRVRKFLPELEQKTGITVARLAQTAAAMRQVREYFAQEVEAFVEAHVRFYQNEAVSFSPIAFNKRHEEIKRRILAYLIQKVGQKTYPPEYKELQRLIENLKSENFGGCTLGDCEIFLFLKRWWIVKRSVGKIKITGSDWEKWVQKHPEYAKQVVPYKLKCRLFESE